MKLVHALMGVAVIGLAGCQTYGNDQGARYLQRIDTVTMSAGDAKAVNANSQMLAAWPPGVGDKRIPMHGARAAQAAQKYRCENASRDQKQRPTQASSEINITVGPQGGTAQGSEQSSRGKSEC